MNEPKVLQLDPRLTVILFFVISQTESRPVTIQP